MNTEKQVINVVKQLKKTRITDIIENLPEKRSRQWISTVLHKLTDEKKVFSKKEGRNIFYTLPNNKNLLGNTLKISLNNKDLEEDIIFEKLKQQLPILTNLNEDLDSILYYTFTEILNNAIEHSNSDDIHIVLGEENNNIIFEITDTGIGIFNNIKQKKKLSNNLEAIQELLKGKTTTMPHSHTGQGVFFTSKIADLFIIDSFNHRLIIDNNVNDIFIEDIQTNKGTKVRFEISNQSKHHLNDVFNEYQAEPDSFAFDKTKILIKLYNAGTIYISRSQARRLTHNLHKFNKIVLDFKDIKVIGQAFTDEIFRVFAHKYPHIVLETINASKTVDFMINRVQ